MINELAAGSALRGSLKSGWALTLSALFLFAASSSGGINLWTSTWPCPDCLAGSFAVDPSSPSTIYVASPRGVFKTTDGGVSWTWSTGVAAFTIWSLAVDPTDAGVVYAAAGTSGMWKSADGGESWVPANKGLEKLAVATVAVTSGGVLAATSGGLFRSADGGRSWTAAEGDIFDYIPFVLSVDPMNLGIVYAINWSGLFRSTDGGMTWTTCGGALAPHEITSVAIGQSALYAGLYRGGVYKSTDDGASWFPVNEGLGDRHVVAVAVSPANSDIVYASTIYSQDAGTYLSSDGGSHWTKVTDLGLPGGRPFVMNVLVDPTAPTTVHVGTSAGVFSIRFPEISGDPVIANIASTSGRPGASLSMRGTGFSPAKKTDQVRFGTYPAIIKKATLTKLVVTIPAACESGRTYTVTATVRGQTSNPVQFTVK